MHMGGMPVQGITSMAPLNLKLPLSHFGVLMLMHQWTKREAIVLAVVNNLTILEKLSYYQIIGLRLGMYAMR